MKKHLKLPAILISLTLLSTAIVGVSMVATTQTSVINNTILVENTATLQTAQSSVNLSTTDASTPIADDNTNITAVQTQDEGMSRETANGLIIGFSVTLSILVIALVDLLIWASIRHKGWWILWDR